jgi:hypothetical protein
MNGETVNDSDVKNSDVKEKVLDEKTLAELKGFDEEIPKWDIALAALAAEEAGIMGQGLMVKDFHRLAEEHVIRFDDIMVTMFELVIQGEWIYQDVDGVERSITRDEVDSLYVGGRIADADVMQYLGLWSPK